MPTQMGTRIAVEVDRIAAGWADSVEGGYASAPVISEKAGPDYIVRKHLGAVQYEDVTIRGGAELIKALEDWARESLALKDPRKDGVIYNCDLDGNIASTLEWQRGVISEIGFPASDAGAKDAACMTVRVRPHFTRYRPGTGKLDMAQYTRAKEKNWQTSNFRLSIQGCEDACKRVSRIEGFSIKQQILEYTSGSLRDREKESVNLETSNLVITLSEAHADPFFKWHESFVVNGKNELDHEKTGRLQYLSPDLKSVLITVDFTGLGIFKLTPEKVEAGSENIRRVKAEMYCEDIKFRYGDVL